MGRRDMFRRDRLETKIRIFFQVNVNVGAVQQALMDALSVEEGDFDVMKAENFSEFEHTVDRALKR